MKIMFIEMFSELRIVCRMIILRMSCKIIKVLNINIDDEEFNYWGEFFGNYKDNIFCIYIKI